MAAAAQQIDQTRDALSLRLGGRVHLLLVFLQVCVRQHITQRAQLNSLRVALLKFVLDVEILVEVRCELHPSVLGLRRQGPGHEVIAVRDEAERGIIMNEFLMHKIIQLLKRIKKSLAARYLVASNAVVGKDVLTDLEVAVLVWFYKQPRVFHHQLLADIVDEIG